MERRTYAERLDAAMDAAEQLAVATAAWQRTELRRAINALVGGDRWPGMIAVAAGCPERSL